MADYPAREAIERELAAVTARFNGTDAHVRFSHKLNFFINHSHGSNWAVLACLDGGLAEELQEYQDALEAVHRRHPIAGD